MNKRPTFLLTYLLAALCLAASFSDARATDYYIALTGTGDGTLASNPANMSVPPAYYNFVVSHRSSGTVIHYAAGTYIATITGSGYSSMWMGNNVTHVGAGIGSTIIKLADGTLANNDYAPIFSAPNSTVSGFKFTDATIDFNTTNTAWWPSSSASGKCIAFAFSLADHCTIQRVKFINIGTKNSESFPVFFLAGNSASGNINHNLVDSCVFTQPVVSGNTGGGLTCIMMADGLPNFTVDATNVISNNQFLGLGSPNSDLQYAQCCTGPVVVNNVASGVDALWYDEPGSGGTMNPSKQTFNGVNLVVANNTLTNCGPIANFNIHTGASFGGILNVQNNSVTMMVNPYAFAARPGTHAPWGVYINGYDSGSATANTVIVQNNTFIAPPSSSPVAVTFDPSASVHISLTSLSILNNAYINFPTPGSENDVNPAIISTYTNTGNVDNKQPAPMVVADWALDEPAGTGMSYDYSVDQIDGTWTSGIAYSSTYPSNLTFPDPGSLSFSGGSNQYVDMHNPAVLPTGTSPRTICGWAKTNTTAAGYRWIASFGSPSTSEGMALGMNGTTLVGSGFGDDLTYSFWDTNWHFVVLTYDGTTACLYADGSMRASSTKTWNLVRGHAYIGANVDGTGSWNGYLDNVQILNYALSRTQIPDIYLGTGPVAHWKLDDYTSPSTDSSANDILGTWVNSPTFARTAPSVSFYDPNSLSLNGTNQYVDMGTPVALPTGTTSRTLCAWAKAGSTASGYRVIAAYGSPSVPSTANAGESMYIAMNGTTLVAGAGDGTDLTKLNFWDTNWHFIALTYQQAALGQATGTATLYADGVPVSTLAKTWSLVPAHCYIGRQVDGTSYWNGLVDEVRIYDYALTSSELSAISH